MLRLIGSLRRMSSTVSRTNQLKRKEKLLERIKEAEKAKKSGQLKNKTKKYSEGADTSKLEMYLLPRAFPHIFGKKIPKKRSETIDMYMHYTPNKIKYEHAARKHAKNEMFQGMERLINHSTDYMTH